MSDSVEKKPEKAMLTRIAIAVLVLLAIVGFGAAGYLFWQNQELQNNPETTQKAQANRAKEVRDKVAKLISLPTDETPTLATVTDKEKLKDQPFFKDAVNGDQILIFPQAKKAIIFRESENRLINVGPIAITSDKTTTEATVDDKNN